MVVDLILDELLLMLLYLHLILLEPRVQMPALLCQLSVFLPFGIELT